MESNTTHIPVNELSNEELEAELDGYRKEYFLAPDGSNAEKFTKNVNKLLNGLVEWYTGTKINIEVTKEQILYETPDKIRDTILGKEDEERNKNVLSQKETPYLGKSIEEGIEDLLSLTKDEVRFNHKFMGQQHPNGNIASFAGGLAAKFINGNTIAQEVSPKTSKLENQVVNWLASGFGYEPNNTFIGTYLPNDKLERIIEDVQKSSGHMTVGGTTANLAAMLVAKNKAFPKSRKKGVKETGVIFGSEYSHYSLEKLTGYVGLGEKNYQGIKTKNKRIIVEELKKEMWIAAENEKKVIGVFATAGTTETGNIDDLEEISKVIKEFEKEFKYKPHFHVDGAHGGGYLYHPKFNPKEKGKLKGIENADSITVDPHKMLYTQYAAGTIIFKEGKDHCLLEHDASYLFKGDKTVNYGQSRVEGSMGLDGVLQTHTSMNTIGQRTYQVIQEHGLRLTNYLSNKLKNEGFEIMNEPETNIVCFRTTYEGFDDEFTNYINKRAQQKLMERGNIYISNDGLTIDSPEGKKKVDVFRAVMMNPYTKREDVDLAVEELKTSISETVGEFHNKLANYETRIEKKAS